jgi:hypothetical protein
VIYIYIYSSDPNNDVASKDMVLLRIYKLHGCSWLHWLVFRSTSTRRSQRLNLQEVFRYLSLKKQLVVARDSKPEAFGSDKITKSLTKCKETW